ncbi:hypothetical protein EVA_21125, partial [gut metagenome]
MNREGQCSLSKTVIRSVSGVDSDKKYRQETA